MIHLLPGPVASLRGSNVSLAPSIAHLCYRSSTVPSYLSEHFVYAFAILVLAAWQSSSRC